MFTCRTSLLLAACTFTPFASAIAQTAADPEQVNVTASRIDMTGRAETASQGSVTRKELQLRPAYRVGQLLETVPGLIVTVHSGEGKANQYLLRGFNLDHGTDFANFVDDMPVNQSTNAHGQGYSDMNFLIPELAAGLDFTKGPFYASVGDFGVVGSEHMRIANQIPNQISLSAGTLNDERAYAGGTVRLRNGDRWLAAFDVAHLGGPWVHPDNYRQINAATRYSHGDSHNGFDVTGMYYRGEWSSTTDQPVTALDQGLISRYGTLDPTDGGHAERFSLSAHHVVSGSDWQIKTSVYGIHSLMTLWNDFTHYLVDPVDGDQEQQDETRTTLGGQTAYTRWDRLWVFPTETSFGIQGRYDRTYIDRRHDQGRVVLASCPDSPDGGGSFVCNADHIHSGNVGFYAQNTTHWLSWMRTIVGLRGDYYAGSDHSLVTGYNGSTAQVLFEPKGSLVFGPWKKSEIYFSAGQGFHSNDLRAVLGTVPATGFTVGSVSTPYMTKAVSEEIGFRTDIIPKLNIQAAAFRIDFASELTYDADNGVNDAGPPSRRQGLEFSAQYHPFKWMELNGDFSFAHAKYFTGNLAAYGIAGYYIPNAPSYIASVGLLIDNLGPWFGGIQMRMLGPYPLIEDYSLGSDGYREVNVDAGYKFPHGVKLQVSVYNLFNTHAASSEYAYEYRLTPTSASETGVTYHPLEPISARFALTATF